MVIFGKIIILTILNLFILSSDSVYYKNFVRHSDGSLCTHTPPSTSFIVFLNNNDSTILTENAPRWDTKAEPNIPGNGTFGVELANFKNLKVGDKVYLIFTCNVTKEQGLLVDSITSIPWARFPKTLYLSPDTFPQPPLNLSLTSDSSGKRIISWDSIPNCKYDIYRKNFSDTIFDGRPRNVYKLIAKNFPNVHYIDTTTSSDLKYGYIIFSVDKNNIKSPHSAEIKDQIGDKIQNITLYPRATSVLITWSVYHNNKVVGYNIYRKTPYDTSWSIIGYTGTDTLFVDSRLNPETIYMYKITARDINMNELAESDVVETTTLSQTSNFYRYSILRIAVVIYKNTNRGQITDDEIEKIKLMLEEGRLFYWRNSLMKLCVSLHYFIIDNYTDFPNPDDAWGSTMKTALDLKNLGVMSTQYDIIFRITTAVNGYWSWGTVDLGLPGPRREIGFSHVQWPVSTDVIYPGKNPQINYNLTWVFVHEVQHSIDAVYSENGHPEMAHGDVPWEFPIPCGEHYDFQAKIFRNFYSYEDLKQNWGVINETPDLDNDGFPDEDPLVPLDELRFGSSPNLKDTDSDGYDDKKEACDGIYNGSNPINQDSDGDGLPDGQDPFPRYRLQTHIPFMPSKPSIDGIIENIWKLVCDSVAFTQIGYSPKLYMGYDNDSLYIALYLENVAIPEIYFDFDHDGWWWGTGNTTMKIDLATGNLQYVNTWDASPEVRSYSISQGGPGGMWDNDPKYQQKFNRKIFNKTDINVKVNISFPKITIEMAITKNQLAGLKLNPGDTIGFNIKFSKVNNDPNQWASLFDTYSFAYVILSEPTLVNNLIDNINKTELYQPYPNPFNSSTTLKIDLIEHSHVELNIYNILGQHIKTIFNGYLNRGSYKFVWRPSENLPELSSGIYIFIAKIISGDKRYILTKKLLYLK